jgi:hypothetical protein
MANYSKLLAALTSLAGVLAAQGVLTGPVAQWVTIAVSALGALGVYAVPNRPSGPAKQPGQGV